MAVGELCVYVFLLSFLSYSDVRYSDPLRFRRWTEDRDTRHGPVPSVIRLAIAYVAARLISMSIYMD